MKRKPFESKLAGRSTLSPKMLVVTIVSLVVLGFGGVWWFSSHAANADADLNHDGKVDVFDLSTLLSHWGNTGSGAIGDINKDQVVNIFDLSALLSSWGTVSPVASCQQIVIPAYFYPGGTGATYWTQALASNPVPSIMIMDPANGPGTAVDSNYQTTIAQAKAKGIKVLGYMTSSYAAANPASYATQAADYQNWYGVTDFFIDEVTSDASQIPYYQSIYSTLHTSYPGSLVMLNPGTTTDEGYVNVSDVLMDFEGSYSDYLGYQMPSWMTKYPASKFAHLVYATPDSASMQNAVNLSLARHAGYVYVTDDLLSPNPWDTLPAYWSAEVTKVAGSCSSG